jgi:Sulfotransferase family
MLATTRDIGSMLDYDSVHAAISDLRKKQIFFIGGTIKSGTTWLQLLLNAHPEVSCHGEGHFTSGLAPILWGALERYNQLIVQESKLVFNEIAGYPPLGKDDFQYLLASCISLSLLRQSKDKPARVVGEKTPSNVRYFDIFDALFPTAKFIHIIRDGRDCAVSGWFHNLRVAREWTIKNHGSLDSYVAKHADYWANDLAKAQAFAEKHQDRVHQIRYEDMAANTERAMADIFDFLNVDAAESVLASCRSEASFATLTGGRPTGDEDLGSFFRKGLPGDWRNHLSKETEAAFRKRAGGWLDRFGYT